MRIFDDVLVDDTLLLLGALLTGFAAAYGRKLHRGKSPGVRWWLARVLLMPFLAIGTLASQELLALSPHVTALTAAMLGLGGHDCVRLLEHEWRRRVIGNSRLPKNE